MDSLYGNKLFCVLDSCLGYLQIPLEERSRHKTLFNMRFGSFQATQVAMGLCCAPATFKKAMQLVLLIVSWEEVIVYLDEIIVHGTNFQDIIGTYVRYPSASKLTI